MLGSRPNYHNFYSGWCKPLTSSAVQTKVNYKSSEEKLEMFRHMEQHMVMAMMCERREQYGQEYDSVSGEEESLAVLARRIVEQLVTAGFQLPQLLTMVQSRGLAALELQVSK